MEGNETATVASLKSQGVKFGTYRLWLQLLCCDFGENGLSSQHAALHGRVGAFDLWDVHEAGAAADEHASRERQLGDGLWSKEREISTSFTETWESNSGFCLVWTNTELHLRDSEVFLGHAENMIPACFGSFSKTSRKRKPAHFLSTSTD